MGSYQEEINIDRDPVLAARDAFEALEYALMHPSQFSQRNLNEMRKALQRLQLVVADLTKN